MSVSKGVERQRLASRYNGERSTREERREKRRNENKERMTKRNAKTELSSVRQAPEESTTIKRATPHPKTSHELRFATLGDCASRAEIQEGLAISEARSKIGQQLCFKLAKEPSNGRETGVGVLACWCTTPATTMDALASVRLGPRSIHTFKGAPIKSNCSCDQL